LGTNGVSPLSTQKKQQRLLSEQELLNADPSDYMDDQQLAFFKDRLLKLYESTQVRIKEAKDQMASPVSSSDENDRASLEEQSNIALRVLDREQKLLPKIRQSLERIRLNEYGYCLESGEEIGIPRLLARPTAEFCADVKALKEIKEHHFRQ
jgi:DnaK suppressor protein